MLHKGIWLWPPARYEDLAEIQSSLHEVTFNSEDSAVWFASKTGKFTCPETWEEIRRKLLQDNWWKLFWFNRAIPKHSFISWLAWK